MTKCRALIFLSLVLPLCSVAYSQSQAEMNKTAFEAFQKSDKRLNAVYKTIFAAFDEKGKKLLSESERAWIIYRDAQAAFEANIVAQDGNMSSGIYNATCGELTDARIKQLLKLFAVDHEEEARKLEAQ